MYKQNWIIYYLFVDHLANQRQFGEHAADDALAKAVGFLISCLHSHFVNIFYTAVASAAQRLLR